MRPPVFAIFIEPADEVQRAQVQSLVVEHSAEWWHGMEDLWLVVGGTAGGWMNLLGPLFPTVPSGRLMVLKVDADADGTWAYRATFGESGQQWIEQNLGVARDVQPVGALKQPDS
jgi:hypothetical protein